jgi:hypothetical protein
VSRWSSSVSRPTPRGIFTSEGCTATTGHRWSFRRAGAAW